MTLSSYETSTKRQLPPRLLKEIHRSVDKWQKMCVNHAPSQPEGSQSVEDKTGKKSVLTHIPRRETTKPQASRVQLPYIHRMEFRASRIKAFGRLFIWLYMIFYFLLGTFGDNILHRDSESRRAVRLRRIIEKAGGTFIKFGQQLSMRIDLLPWAYTVELAKMLDHVPPFPLEQAIEIIERSTGRSWLPIPGTCRRGGC